MDRTSFRLFVCILPLCVVSCTGTTVSPDPVVSTGTGDYQQFSTTTGAPTAGPDTLPLITCPKNSHSDSAAASIGVSGGVVNFGPHQLIIPAGALSAMTRIAARTYQDTLAVDLEPHGLQFSVPATLVLSYKGCDVSDEYATGILYTDTTFAHVLSIVPSEDHYKKWLVVGTINHFSVYASAESRKPR
jgi:hypothetical protein